MPKESIIQWNPKLNVWIELSSERCYRAFLYEEYLQIKTTVWYYDIGLPFFYNSHENKWPCTKTLDSCRCRVCEYKITKSRIQKSDITDNHQRNIMSLHAFVWDILRRQLRIGNLKHSRIKSREVTRSIKFQNLSNFGKLSIWWYVLV